MNDQCMSNGAGRLYEFPAYLKGKIPSIEEFTAALGSASTTLPIETVYVRAAWGEQYVLPQILTRAYRFGPPRALLNADGTLPFAWLYIALDTTTAIWESQFAKSDATAAGKFHLDPAALANGVIARLSLGRALRLWDLTGEACSKLGIFDTISSADHEACHWIGYHLREAMLRCPPGAMPHGFLYPSRRVRGRPAIAIRSDLLGELRMTTSVKCEWFKESIEYRRLSADPLHAASPEPTVAFR